MLIFPSRHPHSDNTPKLAVKTSPLPLYVFGSSTRWKGLAKGHGCPSLSILVPFRQDAEHGDVHLGFHYAQLLIALSSWQHGCMLRLPRRGPMLMALQRILQQMAVTVYQFLRQDNIFEDKKCLSSLHEDDPSAQ